MAGHRMARINEELQRELSALIPTVKDPRVQGVISVTAVESSPDLHDAKVYISVLDQSSISQVLKGLSSAGGYLRRELGHRLALRSTPQLSFISDTSMSQGAHILEILRDPTLVKPVNPQHDSDPEEELL